MDEPAPNPIGAWAPLLAGLVTAGAVCDLVCGAARTPSLSWGGVVMSAAVCVLAAFLAGAAAARVLCAIVPGASRFNIRQLVLNVACAAVWVAPLTLFLQERSALGMAVAAVLAAAATLSFSAFHGVSGEAVPANDSPGLLAEQVFVAFRARPLVRELLPAFCVVACAEAAALAQMTSHTVIAVGLSGASSAVFARSLALKVWPQESQLGGSAERKSHPFLALELALVFAMIGLLPFLRPGMGGGFGWAGNPSRHVFSSSAASGHEDDADAGDSGRQSFESTASDLSTGYAGIILWPNQQQLVKLVAPPVPSRSSFVLGARSSILSIPFNGVYWIFKFPDSHPPRKSHTAHGSPEEFNIRSTDGRPLRLEAHQNLATLIDLSCCSGIQVAIQNADRYPGTVSLELIVRNTTLPGKPSQSLGTALVASTRPWRLYGERPVVGEVLNFSIPPDLKLRQFDEITVVFRLSPDRSILAAKIAVNRFILLPRGM